MLAFGPALPLPVQARSIGIPTGCVPFDGSASPESEKVWKVFNQRKNIESTGLLPRSGGKVVETSTFLDIGAATTILDKTENGRPSFLCRFELTSSSADGSTPAGRNLRSMNMVFGVEEKELATILRLSGRRLLLTQNVEEVTVETAYLQDEVHRLQEELSRSTERLKLLQTNYLTLVEESRKLS